MRGALCSLLRSIPDPRIIPADAGSTMGLWRGNFRIEDHPRGCGEHGSVASLMLSKHGSSPRMRGALRKFSGQQAS